MDLGRVLAGSQESSNLIGVPFVLEKAGVGDVPFAVALLCLVELQACVTLSI